MCENDHIPCDHFVSITDHLVLILFIGKGFEPDDVAFKSPMECLAWIVIS